jgi:hypothetical protein
MPREHRRIPDHCTAKGYTREDTACAVPYPPVSNILRHVIASLDAARNLGGACWGSYDETVNPYAAVAIKRMEAS